MFVLYFIINSILKKSALYSQIFVWFLVSTKILRRSLNLCKKIKKNKNFSQTTKNNKNLEYATQKNVSYEEMVQNFVISVKKYKNLDSHLKKTAWSSCRT